MSEFELVEITSASPCESLPSSFRVLSGSADWPVMELWLGSECWTDRLKIEELPGWRALNSGQPSFHEEAVWEWDSAAHRVLWRGQELWRTDPPRLKPASLDRLPGLLARAGDFLPVDLQHQVEWSILLPAETRLYGAGQRSGPLERRGTSAVNWTTDNPTGHYRGSDPLYQAHPLVWGKSGALWWAILLCHTAYSRFDLAQSDPERLGLVALGSSLCLQIHAAESPSQLLASLRQTLADPQLPPLWALGFHQSRWGYKSGDEITALVDSFRERGLPLDVVHLDIDHMSDYRSFTFDTTRFPHPDTQIKGWRDRGVRIVTIIDPGLKFDPDPAYRPLQSGLQNNHFLRGPSGAPVVGYCWPDEALFPDFSRAGTRDWWAEQAQFYLDHGVAGLWIDMNEPAIFDKPFWTGGAKQQPLPLGTPTGEEEKRLTQGAYRNLYGSLMAQATESAWAERAERPWVLTRASFTGGASYAWSWMGDNTSWWEHLALSFPQLSSMALVHSPFVGVDIGGFFGNCPEDLYGAWIEASVVYPFMRAHSALGTTEQHPWSFGKETEEVARKALRLRYSLLPYLYGSVQACCQEGGLPPLRPLFFDYPDDPRFECLEDQVLFGPHLMACPFLRRGHDRRLVELPAGVWFDLYSGARMPKESTVVHRNPGQIPLFARAGAVVATLVETPINTDQAHHSAWRLLHFPGEERTDLYWDSGDGAVKASETLRLGLESRADDLILSSIQIPDWMLDRTVRWEQPGTNGWEVKKETTFGRLRELSPGDSLVSNLT